MHATPLYLVRHAHAEWSEDEMRPLSDRGRRDAERVAEVIAPAGPAAVYSSPYRRARQTVEPLARRLGLPIEELAELRERALGSFDSSGPGAFEAAVAATWRDFGFAFPGGESNAAAGLRAAEVYRRLTARPPRAPIVLATHGNLLTLMLRQLDPAIGFDFWSRLTMPDVFRVWPRRGGGVEIVRLWNDDAGGSS